MGRRPIYASDEERVAALKEYQKKYREANKNRLIEQGRIRRQLQRDNYSIELSVTDYKISMEARFELVEGYYDAYKKKAIAYKIKSLIGPEYVIDVDSLKLLCKHGYILKTKYEERTDSVTRIGSFNKVRVENGNKIFALHVTNDDMLDLSCSKYELIHIKIGRYNRLKRLVYRYKGNDIEVNIRDMHKEFAKRTMNIYTMHHVKVLDEYMNIDEETGEKYKSRECVNVSESKKGKHYRLKVNKAVDSDVLVEAASKKPGIKITIDKSLSDIDVDGNQIERTEWINKLEGIMESLEDGTVTKIHQDDEIKVLASVTNPERQKTRYIIIQTIKDGFIHVMDTSISTSQFYRQADFSECKQLYTEIDWIEISKTYDPVAREYTFVCNIDKNKKELCMKDLSIWETKEHEDSDNEA